MTLQTEILSNEQKNAISDDIQEIPKTQDELHKYVANNLKAFLFYKHYYLMNIHQHNKALKGELLWH